MVRPPDWSDLVAARRSLAYWHSRWERSHVLAAMIRAAGFRPTLLRLAAALALRLGECFMVRFRAVNAALLSAGAVVAASTAVVMALPADAATSGCSVNYAVSSQW